MFDKFNAVSPSVRHILSVVISVILALIAAKWGITPAPLPPVPQQPQPFVLVIGHPASATATPVVANAKP